MRRYSVKKFLERQKAEGWQRGPLVQGDIMLSFSRTIVGGLIGNLQGRPGTPEHTKLSHAATYVGRGMLAEATLPRGRVAPLEQHYLQGNHYIEFVRPIHWTREQRDRFVMVSSYLANTQYDRLNIARHAFDNFFERLALGRPLARFVKDSDGYARNVCSEHTEWSGHFATSSIPTDELEFNLTHRIRMEPTDGEKFQSGRVGMARPWDIEQWAIRNSAERILGIRYETVVYERITA